MSLGSGPSWWYSCLGVALVLTALVATSSALAQSRRPQYDVTEIQRKVQRSAELQRQALQSLADPAKAGGLAREAWTTLRAAQHEMILNASGAKFADPLFDLNNRRAEQALGHLQVAVDALEQQKGVTGVRGDQGDAPAGSSYVEGVRQQLEQAMRLTNGLAF